jgi:aryl-alcohol dehydrogenase-like predicted oxidoreductase
MWPDNAPLAGIGVMRLSTDPTRDDARSQAVLHAAFDAGLDLIDTADTYALDAGEIGHNERLIAQAIRTWSGDRGRLRVATKGGLTRPDGRWTPDGRARHLRAACDASREALGVSRLALYQLHAPDPQVPWMTTVRALAALQRDGMADAIGLCNVTVAQIEAARAVVPIATVQAELSPWKDRAVAAGVVAYCLAHDIRFLAFRPFGGVGSRVRMVNDPLLREVAAAHRATPFAVVLAWMRGLAPHIVPLPGPTRAESARDCAIAQQLTLTESERTALDRHFPIGRIRTPARTSPRGPSPALAVDDIVMVMGLPGAGKTALASDLVANGYERLNRDDIGGSLAALVPRFDALLRREVGRIVLDNTYLSRASRAAILDVAATHQRAVRGLWLDTSLEEAQVNVVSRMVRTHGRLLTSAELKSGGTPDRLAPSALFRAHREVERPALAEGFARLDTLPFVRHADPTRTTRAVILWCDGVLRTRTTGARTEPDLDCTTLAARRVRLARYQAEGWRLLAISWEPQITEHGIAAVDVEQAFARLRAQLGLDIDFHYCPHGGGPPVCWCRKPLPGLGVWLIDRHQLDPSQCIYVGVSPQDPSFARRLGFQYRDVSDFFA